MEKVAAVFPVLPGKNGSDVSKVLEGRGAEYTESRKRQGLHMERAYEMPTPMGTFVIAYVESDRPFGETTAQLAQSDLQIDRDFVKALAEVHGFDLTAPPSGPPPEVIADWVDPDVTERKRGLAFTVPVRPGAEEKARAFAKEAFETKRDEHAASRRALGITRELVTLNHTPHGAVLGVYLEGDNPDEGNRRFAASRSDYDVWFKGKGKEIFPPEIDLDQPMPPVTQIFDSQEQLVATGQ